MAMTATAAAGMGSSSGLTAHRTSLSAMQLASQGGMRHPESEKTILAKHITEKLQHVNEVSSYLPLTQENLLEHLQDGVVLSYFVALIKPVVPLSKLNRNIDQQALSNKKVKIPGSKHILEATENVNMALKGVNAVGIKLVNVGAEDILNWNDTIVLGLMWQVVRAELLQNISVSGHPELVRLLEDGESLLHLCQEGPETILMRWVNYHIKRAGSDRTITNWTADLKDSECYLLLLSQIGKKFVDHESITEALQGADLHKRAFAVVYNADRLGCAKFLSANDILNCRAHLNLAFLANLFNHHIGIRLPTEEEVEELKEIIERLKAMLRGKGIDPDDEDRTSRALASSERALAKLIARCEVLEKQAQLDEEHCDSMSAMLKKANELILNLHQDRDKLSSINKTLQERYGKQSDRLKQIISRLPKDFDLPPETPDPPTYTPPAPEQTSPDRGSISTTDSANGNAGSSSQPGAAAPVQEEEPSVPEPKDPMEHVEAMLLKALPPSEVAKAQRKALETKQEPREIDNPELLRNLVKGVVAAKKGLEGEVATLQKKAEHDKVTTEAMFSKIEQIATALNKNKKDRVCGNCGAKCSRCKRA